MSATPNAYAPSPRMAAGMAIRELIKTIRACMDKDGPECDLNHLDMSKFVSLDGLFSYELNDFKGDISRWDTSNVTSMQAMFKNSAFNGDISRWDVSKVADMYEMFASCEFRGDISAWNVGCVENMARMFSRTEYRGDLSHWNVSRVQRMREMFSHSSYSGNLSRWDVSRVREMEDMFRFCDIGDISQWDVSNVTNFATFMEFCTCRSDLGNWKINPAARVDGMMRNAAFQGSFPRVPLHADGGYVLPETYFGELADNYTLDEAKALVRNKKWLDLYLKTTAPKGLAPLHMAKAVMLKTKPAWMSAVDFKWVKDQHAVCLGLGMEPREEAKWLAQALLDHKAGIEVVHGSLAFDFSLVP